MHDATQSRRTWAVLGCALMIPLVGIAVLLLRTTSWSVARHPAAGVLREGNAAMAEERFEEAIAFFEKAEAEGGPLPISTLFDRAQAELHLGRTSSAEKSLRALLAREPDHVGANELLCAILRVAGRNWELRPFALELMRKDVFGPGNLAAVTATATDLALKRGPAEESELETFIFEGATARNTIVARASRAHYLLGHNESDAAASLLEEIVAEDPGQLECQALLGSILLSRNQPDRFISWFRSLPGDCWTHPEIWMVAGTWAESEGDRQGAARCYWETLRRHPDHLAATYRLSQMLAALDREKDAVTLAHRAKQLAEVQTAVGAGWSPPSNIPLLARRLETLGRYWESLGWSVITIQRDPQGDIEWARRQSERMRGLVARDTPFVVDALNPATKIDLGDWPVPNWDVLRERHRRIAPEEAAKHPIAFADHAKSAGIDFSYFNGADPKASRAYMFEFSGPGVAVLDGDGDGWPDLYFTQGCRWPPDPRQREFTDRLFRNLGNGRFVDITEQAGMVDAGFGQGAAAGDFDNDGFPDLYVGNIGRNQLYRNNGDGTFTDITQAAGIQGEVWTLSTLIADLNGDTHPDLYDVNYLGGPNVFTEDCRRDGKPIQCFPNQFPAEMDRVYKNLGDRRFRDVTNESGIDVPDGKGMGIVAADFDGSRRLSLFISNDTTANFFFVNQGTPGGEIRFEERGLLSGLAYSASGVSASHMGIAIGDTNGDDRLDVFVTNFQDEANNLYVQEDGLFFSDRIRESNLHDPGYLMEGWGAQFLDGDLDGKMDLVVANGHLDDYPHSPGVNRMPTQFFHNRGAGRFVELPSRQLGSYFEGRYLGRGLARLDWNRDGRPDFCVTHADSPVALLTNETRDCGHYLLVHLRGTASARDAVGARVTLRAGERSWSQQLVAGDGYTASNHRVLMYGLGDTTHLEAIQVEWPSGMTDLIEGSRMEGCRVDAELLLIEGRSAILRLESSEES